MKEYDFESISNNSRGIKRKPAIRGVQMAYNIKEGDKVFHKTFSEGFVTHIDSEYIMVKFPIKECKFKYPSIFEKGFLQKI